MPLGNGTFSSAGTAVQYLFEGFGDLKSAQAYDIAAGMARKQEQFTKEETAVKEFQTQREVFKAIGGQRADVAAAGFAAGGTALDLLRDSTAQGALAKEMVSQQGLITEQAYEAQAQAYGKQVDAARLAATGSFIGAGVAAIGAIASVFI